MKRWRGPGTAVLWLVGTCAAAPPLPPLPDLSESEPQVRALIEDAYAQLEQSPESAEAWGHYASALVVHEFIAEAMPAYETAARLDPQNFRWPYHIAARLSADDPVTAMQYLEQALQARDDYAPLLVRYAGMKALMGDLDAALSSYRRAVELDPHNAYAHAGLGKCLLDTGAEEESKRHLYRAIRLNPRCKPALSALADWYRRAGDLASADEYAGRAAEVPEAAAPDEVLLEVERMGVSTTAVLNRADALMAAGRRARARQEVAKLVQDNPDSFQGRRALGMFLLDDGEYEQAQEQFRAALAVSPDFVDARLQLAYALARMNRFEEARQEYAKVLAADPASVAAHQGLGACLAALGEVDAAIVSFRRAAELAPDDRTIRVGYGKALYYDGRYEAALEVLLPGAKAAGEKPDKVGVDELGFAGLALVQLGRHAEAVDLLERAVSASPGQVDLRLAWSRALEGSGRDAEAVDVLQAGLDRNPRAGRITLALARLLSTSPDDDVRDGERALDLAQRLARATRGRNPAVLDVVACAYAELGRFDDAVRAAEQALAIVSASDRAELAPAIEQRLESFKQGSPVRRPTSSASSDS